MVEYDFKVNKSEINLTAATCQIQRLGVPTNGLSLAGDTLTVNTLEELDKETINSLESLISDSNFGEYPKTAKKLYIGNAWDLRDIIEEDTGKTVLAVDLSERQEDGSYATAIYLEGEDLSLQDTEAVKTSITSMVALKEELPQKTVIGEVKVGFK